MREIEGFETLKKILEQLHNDVLFADKFDGIDEASPVAAAHLIAILGALETAKAHALLASLAYGQRLPEAS